MGTKPKETPAEFARAVNEEVRNLMNQGDAPWSARQLAKKGGWSATYVRARLNDKTAWDVQDLTVVAALLGSSPERIVARAADVVRAGKHQPL